MQTGRLWFPFHRSGGTGLLRCRGSHLGHNLRGFEGQSVQILSDWILSTSFDRTTTVHPAFNDRIFPAASSAPRPLLAELLARLPALVSEPRKSAPAFVTLFGRVDGCTAGLVECCLRGHGYSVLSPAGGNDSAQLVDLVERVRARVVALVAGTEPAARSAAAQIASSVAARLRGAVVAVHDDGRMPLARGVSRVRSMRDLGSLLQG